MNQSVHQLVPLGRLASAFVVSLLSKGPNILKLYSKSGKWSERFKVTGRKQSSKVYYSHSGYPGGLKQVKYIKLFTQNPFSILKRAVAGMLPKNKSRKRLMKQLTGYERE
jgi:large subunit ribosomal protein L13